MTTRSPFTRAVLASLALTAYSTGWAQESPPQLSRERQCIVPVALGPGLMQRTFRAVMRDQNCWVQSICKAVHSFGKNEYDAFVRHVRDESLRETIGPAPFALIHIDDSGHFGSYTNNENRTEAYRCLALKAETAAPETQSALYLIGSRGEVPTSFRLYRWLKKAAVGGDPSAQLWLSELIGSMLTGGVVNTSHTKWTPPDETRGELSSQRYHFWLEKAAASGLRSAQWRLVSLYLGHHRHIVGVTTIRFYEARRLLLIFP